MAKALKKLKDLKVNNSLCCQKRIILVRWKQVHKSVSVIANMTHENLLNSHSPRVGGGIKEEYLKCTFF